MCRFLALALSPLILLTTGCLVVSRATPTPHPEPPLESAPSTRNIHSREQNNTVILGGHTIIHSGDRGELITGEGEAVAQARKLARFTELNCSGIFEVEVVCGKPQSVTVIAQPNLQARIHTDVQNGTLTLSTQGSLRTDKPLRVRLTCPTLSAIASQGTGSVRVSNLNTDELEVESSGTGAIVLSGAAATARLHLAGTGSLDANTFQVEDMTVTLSGTGSAIVWATQSLEATVAGTGSLLYRGTPPQLHPRVTGTGSIHSR